MYSQIDSICVFLRFYASIIGCSLKRLCNLCLLYPVSKQFGFRRKLKIEKFAVGRANFNCIPDPFSRFGCIKIRSVKVLYIPESNLYNCNQLRSLIGSS